MQGRTPVAADPTGSVGEAYKGRTVGATGRLDERRPDGTVTCYSLAGFRELRGELDVAVISIADDGRCEVESSGWGAMLRVRFTDVEFDEEYLKVWGWHAAGQAGFITPTIARSIARYVASEEVGRCRAMVVHCHAGESRSTAVGTYIAEQRGYRLMTTSRRCNPNRTVLRLLRDPDALGSDDEVRAVGKRKGMVGWLKAMFG